MNNEDYNHDIKIFKYWINRNKFISISNFIKSNYFDDNYMQFLFCKESEIFFNEWLNEYRRTVFVGDKEKYLLKITFVEDLLIFEKEKRAKYLYYMMIYLLHERINTIQCELADKSMLHSYYRGQENSDWLLIPSLLRKTDNNVLIDGSYIFNKYKQLGLLRKYQKLFSPLTKINYELVSFIQHACSFSPLLDFTESEEIAKTFAAAKTSNLNEYSKNKCAVYNVRFYENDPVFNNYSNIKYIHKVDDADNFLEKDFKIYNISDEQISLGEPMEINAYKNNELVKEKLTISSMQELIKYLTPKIAIIDIRTNDRMKYQKGLFIVFYNCIAINGTIFYQLASNMHLDKKVYKYSEKIKINENMRKNNYEYLYEYLLDPYKVFNE